jgi:hypothetical protein
MTFNLPHGGIYMMCGKTTGCDWKKSSIMTLRYNNDEPAMSAYFYLFMRAPNTTLLATGAVFLWSCLVCGIAR